MLSYGSVITCLLVGLTSAALRLDIKCNEHGKFSCSDHDPTVFTRCLEGQLFQFYCPDGLHFNTKTQTCDWPEAADCTFQIKSQGGKRGVFVDEEKGEEGAGEGEGEGKEGGEEEKKAEQGHPWWRPKNVDPSSWEDVDFVWENPDMWTKDTEPTEEDLEKKAEAHEKAKEAAKKKKAKGGKKGGESINASADKTQRPGVGTGGATDGSCDRDSCKLPKCFCPGTVIPSGLSAKEIPQMVMITFDDEMSAEYYGYFQRLFRPGRYNPNGCPVRGALYVSGQGTDWDLVYPMYAMGMEIASHTRSHRFPHTWWSSASYDDLLDEIVGQKKDLNEKAGIPMDAIKGFRVPFLQVGGDNMYKALYDGKFVYDTSMFTGPVWEEGEGVWPFTLDNVPKKQYCQHGPCPKTTYPGLWEIPVQRYYGLDGHSCGMADGCTPTADTQEHIEFLRLNFKRYYQKNKAPFGIFVHARWFHTQHHIDALDLFIDELLKLDDVYIVTPTQVIEWMKKPTPLSSVNKFAPWGCEGSADKRK